jgi:hypothetical protein
MTIILFCRNGHNLSTHDAIYMGRRSVRQMIAAAERAQWEKLQPRQPFCSKCGASTLDACEHCGVAIPPGRRPSYCGQCEKPFPWTETALTAAKEYADELSISQDEKTALKATLDDLTVDTPRTELAAHKFKNILRKVGPAAGDALKSIVVNFATETAKKWIG